MTLLYDFEGKFLNRSKVDPSLINIPGKESKCWYLTGEPFKVVDRLIPIFHLINALDYGEDLGYLMTEVKSYLLMWPGKCTKEFETAFGNNNTDTLIVMLCFYVSTLWLVSKDVWWVQERSKFMCTAILQHLDQEGYVDDRVRNICEYFKINRH